MSNYTFLTKTNEGGPTRYFAISEDRIEDLRTSQTFDDFGQKVGTYNVGDSIELLSDRAIEIANEVAKEQDESYDFIRNDVISGYDHSDVFDLIEAAFDEAGLEDIEDYYLYAETCKGFNYWDGSNHRTIVTYNEYTDFGVYEVVTDDDLTAELNSAIENMGFVAEPTGGKTYEWGKWTISESFYQGHWEDYEIVASEDFYCY